MTVHMFRLEPGGSVQYVVRPVSSQLSELGLDVRRPDEGLSTELELQVSDPGTGVGARGRVAIDQGYLAVVLEVRRQIEELGTWGGQHEFDLLQVVERRSKRASAD